MEETDELFFKARNESSQMKKFLKLEDPRKYVVHFQYQDLILHILFVIRGLQLYLFQRNCRETGYCYITF